MDEDYNNKLEHYIEIGVVEIAGMDENGEMIYSINQELARELAPELWQSHVDYVDRSLIELYEAGLVEIEYDENLQAILHLSPEGQKIAKEKGLVEIDPREFKDIPND